MLLGNEISVFSFTDGSYLTSLIAASDYKRALKGNLGPNTGGMGSFSPPRNWSNELAEEINLKIMKPVVRELGLQGSPFKGILYGGIILTAQGPKVIEFNCRFGDPEAQVIIPRMKTDLMEVFSSIANRTLRNCVIEWDDNSCVSVVLCSAGYPSEHKAGAIITGFEKLPDNILTFHAGTSIITKPNGVKLITVSGGRVINLVSKGTTLSEASSSVYDNINSIKFLGSFFRTDIGVF
jgi:phosphoribosylamine--glycine ligase